MAWQWPCCYSSSLRPLACCRSPTCGDGDRREVVAGSLRVRIACSLALPTTLAQSETRITPGSSTYTAPIALRVAVTATRLAGRTRAGRTREQERVRSRRRQRRAAARWRTSAAPRRRRGQCLPLPDAQHPRSPCAKHLTETLTHRQACCMKGNGTHPAGGSRWGAPPERAICHASRGLWRGW